VRIEHLQDAAAGVDLVVMGQIGKPFEDAEQVLVPAAVMGLTLTLNRMGQAGRLLSIGLMGAGTALVFFGLYEGGWSR
jgi:hypothetical protein